MDWTLTFIIVGCCLLAAYLIVTGAIIWYRRRHQVVDLTPWLPVLFRPQHKDHSTYDHWGQKLHTLNTLQAVSQTTTNAWTKELANRKINELKNRSAHELVDDWDGLPGINQL